MKKVVAEIISTFFLVFIGTGSVILNVVLDGKITLAGISMITGTIVALMILLWGSWSGAHMNPAVSLALYKNGELDKREIIPYILAQFVGAVLGSLLLRFIFKDSLTLGETLPSLNVFVAFLIEIGLTLFLMLVILIVSSKKIPYSAWIIGLAVAIGIFAGGSFSGGSMNPIRSLAPALVNNNLAQVWIFLTAPFAGSLLAVYLFKTSKK